MATGGYAEAVLVALALVALLLAPPAVAAPLRDVPVRVVQPGGEVLDLLASGDEFRRVAHDAAGFTVVRDPVTSLVVYADLAGGRLVPTGLVVGAADPRDAGLSPGLAPATNEVLRAAWQGALAGPGSPPAPAGVRGAPRVGTLNNLVVFIRFADEPAFSTPFSYYRTLFDDPDPSRPSLYGYFAEASYGRLAVRSTFYPAPVGDAIASYQAEHPRAYYQPRHPDTNPDGYEDGLDAVMREHELLAAALESVAGQIPPGLDVDGDDDGMVDNLVFILSGGPDAWADLLWPHMALLTKMVVVNGATALLYNLQLDEFVRSGKQLGVLAHELFHTLGAPDMYHYSHDGLRPLGPWDLMESDQPVPQHMCAHVKRLYGGWIDAIPEITTNGRYTLAPLAEAPGAAYRFAAQGSKTEYFVVEYRRATGVYESSLPGSGLVVFRVDGARDVRQQGRAARRDLRAPARRVADHGRRRETGVHVVGGRPHAARRGDGPASVPGRRHAVARAHLRHLGRARHHLVLGLPVRAGVRGPRVRRRRVRRVVRPVPGGHGVRRRALRRDEDLPGVDGLPRRLRRRRVPGGVRGRAVRGGTQARCDLHGLRREPLRVPRPPRVGGMPGILLRRSEGRVRFGGAARGGRRVAVRGGVRDLVRPARVRGRRLRPRVPWVPTRRRPVHGRVVRVGRVLDGGRAGRLAVHRRLEVHGGRPVRGRDVRGPQDGRVQAARRPPRRGRVRPRDRRVLEPPRARRGRLRRCASRAAGRRLARRAGRPRARARCLAGRRHAGRGRRRSGALSGRAVRIRVLRGRCAGRALGRVRASPADPAPEASGASRDRRGRRRRPAAARGPVREVIGAGRGDG
ncbi:MAG: M6 family metalloprotease domain-containing protein [Deltaproteobacteria bacterium]|nr:M6 family metalloprotease domain-containing protein [Deltaproteobacteria bacterium]